jgi:FkbM family methyltransferase
MKVINNGRPLFGPHANGMLDMFSSVDPGLVVDVGAAAGHITRYLLNVSPASHAVAFEPFPGNWKFIEKTLGGDCRATIVRKAVADKEGEASFFVSSTAKGDWQAMSGYSSVGYVMSDDQAKENGKAIKVPVTTLAALWSSHPNPLGAVPAPTIFFRRAHSMSPATDTLVRMTYPREPLR